LKASKIGITNVDNKSSRVSRWQNAGWVVKFSQTFEDGALPVQIEKRIFDWIREEKALPEFLGPTEMSSLGGHTETFSTAKLPEAEVRLRLLAEITKQYGL
jgi:hypothetical protein